MPAINASGTTVPDIETAIIPAPAATRHVFGTRTPDPGIPLAPPGTFPAGPTRTRIDAKPSLHGMITPSPHRTAGDRAWIPAGAHATVAGYALHGLVYVGRVLVRSDGYGRNDNCLIDPGLTVSKANADTSGQHMDYWPAYESMRPSSRRAFLEWLSGDRSDPGTYIGYVFVYLYGLERRGVLERSLEDRVAIRAEVERLISVYGRHGSFQRYASELLSALDILDLTPGQDPTPVFHPSGGELPAAVRIAVGSRIRDGRAIDAEWLLAWTMAHPETRVRVPARRAFDHLRAGFATAFDRRNPSGGLLLAARQGKDAPIRYRAASGSFTVGFEADGMGTLPDLASFPEALAMGRELLETCTDGLEAYSRQLGKGTAATLRALAMLPVDRREHASGGTAGETLSWLRTHAVEGVPLPFPELSSRILGQSADKATSARLRDLGDTLCRFGLGMIPDPRFPTRAPSIGNVLLFPLDAPSETVQSPSASYNAAFLALSVGMLVARADGEVVDEERAVLHDMASASPDLTPDERRRLVADALWLEAYPAELPSLRARLSELGDEHRRAIGATLVRVASSDGSHHRAEIALLEKAFRHMGLDQHQLYAALHQAGPAPEVSGSTPGVVSDLVRVELGAGRERTYLIPMARTAAPGRVPLRVPSEGKAPAVAPGAPHQAPAVAPGAPHQAHATASPVERVDMDRLAAIRAETNAIGSILSDVFNVDTETALPGDGPAVTGTDPEESEGHLAGLDARHTQLLSELVARSAWPRAEFDRLAREFGLMPGAAMENLNGWAFDRFDDVLIEEGDPVHVNQHLIPVTLSEAA